MYREAYACARRSYNLQLDGRQCELTTLCLWGTGKIHLVKPSKFTTETHVGAERAVFLDFHRGQLGFRLFAELPEG